MTRTEGNQDPAVFELQAFCHQVAENSYLPMVAVAGPEHVICYVNPAFCTFAEKSSEELIGVPIAQVVPERKDCLPLLERLYRPEEAISNMEQEDFQEQPRWSYSMWAVPHAFPRPSGILIQVADATRAVQPSHFSVDFVRELMITSVRQHELLEGDLPPVFIPTGVRVRPPDVRI